MPKQTKIYQVENLTESLKSAKSAAFIDYQNLDAAQTTELRQNIKEAGGSMQVAKNTLLRRALKNIGIELDEKIKGPTALVFAQENTIGPLKAINEMAQKLERPQFKFGILDNEFLPLKKLQKLVNLPNKKVLISRLVNGVNAPLVKLANALQFNQRKLVLVLKSINEQESKKA